MKALFLFVLVCAAVTVFVMHGLVSSLLPCSFAVPLFPIFVHISSECLPRNHSHNEVL